MTTNSAVILDCDGVILNSEELHFQASNDAFRDYGICFTREEYFSKYVGLSDKDCLRIKLELNNTNCNEYELTELVEHKKRIYLENLANLKQVPFIPGVEKFIKHSVNEGKILGVCSGSSRDEVLLALSKLDNGELTKYFKTIVTIDDLKSGKPSSEGYKLACQNINQRPSDCLAIEDSPAGVKAAINAGLSVYALLTTHNIAQLQQADRVCRSFYDLLN